MQFPLVIAILALLAFALLPVLDHLAGSQFIGGGLRDLLIRMARWVRE